jgi:hypothetical protein
VGSSRILSGLRVVLTNGFDDHEVLIADLPHELKAARFIRTCHAGCCREVLGEKIERSYKIRIACRLRDRTVKSDIRHDTVATRGNLGIDSVKGLFNLGEL